MLQVKTEEQLRVIAALLGEDFDSWTVGAYPIRTLSLERPLSFDEMAKVVDHLRKGERERRRKARQIGIHSNIDKLWVTDDTIWLRGCDETQVKMFIDELGDIGYDVDELTQEYLTKGRITI